MSREDYPSQARDPANKLDGFDPDGPIGVPNIHQASKLLKVSHQVVKRAAQHVQPWTTTDGRTFYSTRQLARAIVRERAKKPRRSNAKIRTRTEAKELAAYLAEHGPDATAEKYGIPRGTIYHSLKAFKIPPPVGKGGPGIPRPRKTA